MCIGQQNEKHLFAMSNNGIIFLALAALTFSCNVKKDNADSVRSHATPFARSETAPSASDVTMRTLRFRPMQEGSHHNTFEALDAFHANRLEWTYLNFTEDEAEKIRKVKESGRLFGGASGSSSGTDVTWHDDGTATKKHVIVDINGDPVIKGHQIHWARPGTPGCVNNPEYREGHLNYLKRYIDAGIDAMQRDEPSYSHNWGKMGTGCFCDHCMKGFPEYLEARLSSDEILELGIEDLKNFNYKEYVRTLGFDLGVGSDFDWSDKNAMGKIVENNQVAALFADFQGEATGEFYSWIIKEMNSYAGKYIIYSCNNTSFQNWEEPYFELFDFCMSELMLRSANPAHIYERAQRARQLGKMQVFGSPKTMGVEYPEKWLKQLKRKVIATSYASGALSRVPWDIFEQTRDGGGRYFGDPADYADLYGFVRGNHGYLDGYCTAGAFGSGINDSRYGERLPVILSQDNDSIYLFLRAKPKDPSAPVVIHLVDWNEKGTETELRLLTEAFFTKGDLKIDLLKPTEYNAVTHKKAEELAQKMRKEGEQLGPAQAEAYKELIERNRLKTNKDGDYTVVNVPVLDPWAVLVISI
jgi:hypothetical protein